MSSFFTVLERLRPKLPVRTAAATSAAVIVLPDRREVAASSVVDDLSLHRVWWRKHWVLWYDDPRQFEAARPWSHKVPVAALAAPVVLTVASYLLLFLGPLMLLAAMLLSAGAMAFVGVVVLAEARFTRWVRGNDGRVLLEGLLPPTRHHPAFLTSPVAQSASRALSQSARAAVEEFARAHSQPLRGIRRYRTPGFVRLSVLTEDTRLLLALISAAGRFRALNESWGSGDDWDAAFTDAKNLTAERRQHEAAAQAVLDAIRAIHHSSEAMPARDAMARLGVAHRREPRAPRFNVDWDFWGLFSVLGPILFMLLTLGAIIATMVTAMSTVARDTMPVGTNSSCTIAELGKTHDGMTLVDTSCGAVNVPAAHSGQVESGQSYDFEVNRANGVNVGIPMGPSTR